MTFVSVPALGKNLHGLSETPYAGPDSVDLWNRHLVAAFGRISQSVWLTFGSSLGCAACRFIVC
jgi:hypothetical protein